MSDLSELFARDPLSMSDLDIDTIVARLREAQAQYELGPAIKAPAKKTTSVSSKATTNLLKDLGLT